MWHKETFYFNTTGGHKGRRGRKYPFRSFILKLICLKRYLCAHDAAFLCYWHANVSTGWTEASRTGLSNQPDRPDGAAHTEERRIKHVLWSFGLLHSKATDDQHRAALHKRLQISWNLLTRDKIYMRLSSGSAKKAFSVFVFQHKLITWSITWLICMPLNCWVCRRTAWR